MNDKINKNLYKVFLSIVKFTPLISGILQIILMLFNYNGNPAIILTYLGGTSILFIGLLFIISYVFKFCYLYRIPLWYNTVMLFLGLLRTYGLLPLELLDLYRLYAIISGLFILLFISFMYKTRNNPKIDHIKHLCEAFCCP